MNGRSSAKLTLALAMLLLATAAIGGTPARGEESAAATGDRWGDLTGRIVVNGDLPKSDLAKEFAEVCGDIVVYDDSLLVGADGGLANAFVWLDQTPPSVHSERAAEKSLPVRLAIDGCRFQPHAVVVQAGQTLTFRNLDDVGHNPLVDTFVNTPAGALIPSGVVAGRSRDRVFEKAEPIPCPVRCAIYPWMSAYVLPVEHPYATTTDANGRFRIENLPLGDLRFRVWHERTGWIVGRFLAEAETATDVSAKGRFERSLSPGSNDLGTLSVAAATLRGR